MGDREKHGASSMLSVVETTVLLLLLGLGGWSAGGCCYIFECEKPEAPQIRYTPPPVPPRRAEPGMRLVAEKYLEWHEEQVPRVELSCRNSKQTAGDIALEVRLLDPRSCAEDASLNVSVTDERGWSQELCVIPETGNGYIIGELEVTNKKDHVFQFDRFLPALAVHGTEFLSLVAGSEAFGNMWKGRAVQVPHPELPEGCTNCIERIGIAKVDGLDEIVRRHFSLNQESFVLPKSKRSFYFAFRIPEDWLKATADVPFVLGFYDLVVSSSASGAPSLVTYVEVPCVASVTWKVFQLAEQKVRQVQVSIPARTEEAGSGEAAADESTERGSAESVPAVTSLDFSDPGALADASSVLKGWIGKTVLAKTKKGEECKGVLKGLWGLTVSVDLDGTTQQPLKLTDLESVRIVQ